MGGGKVGVKRKRRITVDGPATGQEVGTGEQKTGVGVGVERERKRIIRVDEQATGREVVAGEWGLRSGRSVGCWGMKSRLRGQQET